MSYLINPYRFGAVTTPIYNGVSVIYELERPNMTTLWTNAVLKIRRDSDNNTAFVFFLNNSSPSANDVISLSSAISTSSDTDHTVDASTLGTWLGANNGYVETQYGITDNNSIDTNKKAVQTTTTLQPQIASSGVLKTKGGKTTIEYVSTKRLTAEVNTDLDNGNDFTIFSVTHNFNSNSGGGIFSTVDGNVDRVVLLNDRRAISIVMLVRTPAGTIFNTTLIQRNVSDQKLLTNVVDGTAKSTTPYYKGVIQNAQSWTNVYGNSKFHMGIDNGSTRALNGGIQLIAVFPNITVDRASFDTDIISRYSIP